MDSTAVEIGKKVNLCPDDYRDVVGFYNAVMDRLEDRRGFAGEMFYMVRLKQDLSGIPGRAGRATGE